MPGGTTAIAISAGASATAAAASAAAELARCEGVLDRYIAKTASVAEARDYAGCVYRVHGSGEPMSEGVALALKIVIALCLMSMPVGAVFGWREDGFVPAVMGAILAPLGIAFVAGTVFLVGAGLAFLVS